MLAFSGTNGAGQTVSKATPLPVDIGNATLSVTASGVEINNDIGNPIPAGGVQAITTASFTRPADTTAYAALDVVSNSTSAPTLLTFSGAGRAVGGSGLILSARHLKNSTATAGASYRLHLYKVNTVTATNDNSPFPMLFANRTNRIGFIDFTHTIAGTGSDCTFALSTFVNLPFVCDAAASAIYGILTVSGAYTPTSGEQHFIELAITQN
jgi:hypothetical protein